MVEDGEDGRVAPGGERAIVIDEDDAFDAFGDLRDGNGQFIDV